MSLARGSPMNAHPSLPISPSRWVVADLLQLPPETVVTKEIEAPSNFFYTSGIAYMQPELGVESVGPMSPKIEPIEEDFGEMGSSADFLGQEDDNHFFAFKGMAKLDQVNVNEVVNTFVSGANEHRNCSKYHDIESFRDCLSLLFEHNRIIPPSEEITDALFRSMDHGSGGKIPLSQVTTGLALLAGGSQDDKVSAVFALVDSNEDGYLSLSELVEFFTLIFQNVFSRSVVNAMAYRGVPPQSPAELAARTAVECMEMCDLNKDGQLSLEEFKKWFVNPKNVPSI